MDAELPTLDIKPNVVVAIPLEEKYFEVIEAAEDIVCRVMIQDHTNHGIILPANIQNKNITFILPEQLCIFNPEVTYTLVCEVLVETQLLTVAFGPCRIDLQDLEDTEEDMDEREDEEDTEASEEAYTSSGEDDRYLEEALNLIAPVPVVQQGKKTRLEDLAKGLDEDFVKHALFQSPEKQQAPTPVRASEPVITSLTSEQLAIKARMKALLRGMLS